MVVTLKEIYDSVLERYPGNVTEINATPLIDYINETYITIRDEYIKSGRFEKFTINKEFPAFIPSRQIPYLNYIPIKPQILQHFTFDKVVLYTICRMHPSLVGNTTWKKGDKAWKGSDLFEAVTDINDIVTDNLTFENCDVRNFYSANGLKYKIGDVVNVDGDYYRATVTHINDHTESLDSRSEWERVYWRYVGIGFKDPEIIDFDQLDRKKANIDAGNVVVSFDEKNIYTTQNVRFITIAYVPVHEWKTNNEDTFRIPDSALSYWKRSIMTKMGMGQGLVEPQSDE